MLFIQADSRRLTRVLETEAFVGKNSGVASCGSCSSRLTRLVFVGMYNIPWCFMHYPLPCGGRMGKADHFMENRLPECVGTPFASAE